MLRLIDHHVVKQYQQELTALAKEMSVPAPEDWFSVLMRLPDTMKQGDRRVGRY